MTEASWPLGQPGPPGPPDVSGPFGPVDQPQRRRPWSVVLALVLLLVAAFFALLAIVHFVNELMHVDALIDQAAQATGADAEEVDAARSAAKVVDGTGIGMCLFIAASFTGLGLWSARGSHVARVLACVVAGLTFLVCCGCGGLVSYLGSQEPTGETEFSAELTRLEGDAVTPLALLLLVAVVVVPVCAVAAFVMLVLPPSNRYFRPPAPVAAPPQGWSPYYAYPDQSYWTGEITSTPTEPDRPEEDGDHRPPP